MEKPTRNNVTYRPGTGSVLMFAHGFGCDDSRFLVLDVVGHCPHLSAPDAAAAAIEAFLA